MSFLAPAALLFLIPNLVFAQVTLSAVGDIRLDGPVGEIISRGQDPASAIKSSLEADIVFGNLECPLTKRGTKQPKTWNFRAPAKNLESLKEAGFNLLNIANNHSWDYGETGFLDTLAALEKNKMTFVGGGENRQEAEKLRVAVVNGLRVGFLGFTSTFPQEAWAKTNKPGVAYSDYGRVPEVIQAARPDCDVLVVSFHGGTELATEPNDIQKSFAHAAVDAGADLILGHHPHVLQALEVYEGKPILYSLGNFLFVSPTPETKTTVIARATLSAAGVDRIDFLPIDTNWGRPKTGGEKEILEATAALDRLGALTRYPDRFIILSTKPD